MCNGCCINCIYFTYIHIHIEIHTYIEVQICKNVKYLQGGEDAGDALSLQIRHLPPYL